MESKEFIQALEALIKKIEESLEIAEETLIHVRDTLADLSE